MRRWFSISAGLALLVAILTAGNAAAQVQHHIDVSLSGFKPDVVHASNGDRVRWFLNDRGTCYSGISLFGGCSGHDVTSYGGDQSVASGRLTQGQAYAQDFTGGTILYRCTIHSYLSDGICRGLCGAITDRTAAPQVPSFTSPLEGQVIPVESLASNGGTYYRDAQEVEVRGRGEPWTTVSIMEGGKSYGTAGVDGSGDWRIVVGLSAGSHTVHLRAKGVLGATTDSPPITVDIRGAPETDVVVTMTDGWSLSPRLVRAVAGQTVMWRDLRLAFDSRRVIGYEGSFDVTSGWNDGNFPIYVKTFGGGTSFYFVGRGAVSSEGTCDGACGVISDRTSAPLTPRITYPIAGSLLESTSVAISVEGEPYTIVSVHEGSTLLGRHLIGASGTWTLPPAAFKRGFHTLQVSAADPYGRATTGSDLTFKVHVPPTDPTGVNGLRGPDPGMIRLGWSPPADHGGGLTYRLYRAEVGGAFSPVAEVPFGVTTYSDTNLPEGAVRRYRVTATNDAGESVPSQEIAVQAPERPSAPRELQAWPGAPAGGILLTWAHPVSSGGISMKGYKVYRATGSSGYSLLAVVGTAPTYTDQGCRVGICSYQVAGFNAVGEGPRSNEASFVGVKGTVLAGGGI